MDINKELDFLQYVSMGLFNKKHIDFELTTAPLHDEERYITVSLQDERFSDELNNIDIKLLYYTNNDRLLISQGRSIGRHVRREEAVNYIKSLLKPKKEEYDFEYSDINDQHDFYDIIQKLSDQVFTSPNHFELNVSRNSSLHLYNKLNVKYGSLEDAIRVFGGVGTEKGWRGLDADLTCLEYGKSPQDNTYYVGVFSNIAKDAKRPEGIYSNATPDIFMETLLEQIQSPSSKEV